MNDNTISMLFKWGPWVILLLVILFCFGLGVIRGRYKSIRRVSYFLLVAILLWAFMIPLTRFVLNFEINSFGIVTLKDYIINFIESNEEISKFLDKSVELRRIVESYPEVIVSPLLFVVLMIVIVPILYPLYWLYVLLYNLIAKLVFKRNKYMVDETGKVLRNDKGKKVKVDRKAHRLQGGLISIAQGLMFVGVTLLPLNFVNRVVSNTVKETNYDSAASICSLDNFKDFEEYCKYLDMYNDTIFAKIGGNKSLDKYINDHMTTIKIDDWELNLEDELTQTMVSVVLLEDSGLLELFMSGDIDLANINWSKINFDKIDMLIDALFDSNTLSSVIETGVNYVLSEALKDRLIDLLKDDDIVSKLTYENKDEIKADLKEVSSTIRYIVEKEMYKLIVDNVDNPVLIVNGVNESDIEVVLNKLLSVKILSKAMPSVVKAYGEKYGVNEIGNMSDELNEEIVSNIVNAVKFVKTMELTNFDELTEGNLVDNLGNLLFENGVIKDNSKDSMATLLHSLNSSYLFKDVLSTQINKLLEDKDYKVDARVMKYVDSKDGWIKELEVLENAYNLYDEYDKTDVIDYAKVTNLLEELGGTKVFISVLPFAYDELLPKLGVEIDSEGFPVIDFDGENEDSSKVEFYNTWESELVILKEVADAAGILELQGADDVTTDMLKDETKVDALSTIMGEVYKSELLKDGFTTFMLDKVNDFVVEYEVEFSKEELLVIDTKEEWKNEFTNINNVLEIDFSDENNITRDNLEVVFDSIDNMQLFANKKVSILKYAIKKSGFLSEEEYSSINWDSVSWSKETDILLNIVEKRDTIENMSTLDMKTFDSEEIGGLVNTVMSSDILKPIVVNKISVLFVNNDVRDDRDIDGDTSNLKNSISSVSDWKVELGRIKEMLNVSENNMSDVGAGETKNMVEKMFESIESSTLLQNTRAHLLIKAINTINLDGVSVPSDVTVGTLKDNEYANYNKEKDIIIKVSKSKDVFDNFGEMSLSSIDTNAVGDLLDTVIKSDIFGDYVVEEIKKPLVNNEVLDDRDIDGDTSNLEASIRGVTSWASELNIIKEMLNMTSESFSTVVDGKTIVEKVFDDIESSTLLQNTRAHLLIKAINTINLEGASVPSDVTVDTLKATYLDEEYYQYNRETDVFITFAKNREAIEGLNDLTSLELVQKKAMGEILDAMKLSKIMSGKYTSTINSALSVVKNNENLTNYGVTFKDDYSDVVWSSVYDENDNITTYGEIENLSIINSNIATVKGYNSDSLVNDKNGTINMVGTTLDAVSRSMLIVASEGTDTADQVIANQVISQLTNGMVTSVSKEEGKTWTEAFEEALGSY